MGRRWRHRRAGANANAGAAAPGAVRDRQHLRCLVRHVGPAGVPGVIDLRDLTVEVTDPSSSVTYVRVDANVAWIPVRPAAEKVPVGVKVVTITASPDMNHRQGTPGPVTVTSPAKVAQIVALMDGLSLETRGAPLAARRKGRGHHAVLPRQAGGPVLATAERADPELRQHRLHHRRRPRSRRSPTPRRGSSRARCSPSPACTGPAGTSDAPPSSVARCWSRFQDAERSRLLMAPPVPLRLPLTPRRLSPRPPPPRLGPRGSEPRRTRRRSSRRSSRRRAPGSWPPRPMRTVASSVARRPSRALPTSLTTRLGGRSPARSPGPCSPGRPRTSHVG